MPAWIKSKDFNDIYALRDELTAKTGVEYHNDHIVPLKCPEACGLHVPWNLCPIPALDNLQKQNKLSEHDRCWTNAKGEIIFLCTSARNTKNTRSTAI
jgi:hypothetical protein